MEEETVSLPTGCSPLGVLGRVDAPLAFDLTQIVVGGREACSAGSPGRQMTGGEGMQGGRRVMSPWLEDPQLAWESQDAGWPVVLAGVTRGTVPERDTQGSLVGGQRPLPSAAAEEYRRFASLGKGSALGLFSACRSPSKGEQCR